MTMAFSTDTLNGINENSIATTAAAAKQQMNDDDLNLDKILRATASATVKFLLKRNAQTGNNISNNDNDNTQHNDVIGSGDDDNDDNVYDENAYGSKTEYETTAANNLSATITSIRSNVSKVLYMYFQNKTAAAADNDVNVSKSNEAVGYDDPSVNLTPLSINEKPLATASSALSRIATKMTSEILQNSTYNNSNLTHITADVTTTTSTTATTPMDNSNNFKQQEQHNSNVIVTTMTHLNEFLNATTTTAMPSNTTTNSKCSRNNNNTSSSNNNKWNNNTKHNIS
ncbi:uncharacterized protein DDB_G0287625-like [Lucilia sericata]|uniref:uncharacterized protein DDB_G0287625-like n=1 Tax=Lucilia sericata TaxID=13632 RepID=UPI0018A82933|nr:uncharacterized protein DDB_G0287625-like [Lucilia sericata]